jgi:site-specific DNA-methyltransferase (adenine-specific)
VHKFNLPTVYEDGDELDIDKMKKSEMQKLLHDIFDNPTPSSVINERKPTRSEAHPTMKPVRLFGYQIANSSRPGNIILDTFGGSGTTIVAAEQLDRKARLMELDPHYCDVIIARWEKLTGQKAIKLNQ